MPRQARLVVPGVPVHVIQRGNNRGACFFSDDNRLRYLSLLRELAAGSDCVVHAYVLMSNHVHLLLTPMSVKGLARAMRRLSQRYAQYVNRVTPRTGCLWEGRFYSSLVETESYFMTCQRYIDLNPVRAGLADRPADYVWSSHRVYANGKVDALITPHEQYVALGRDPASRQAAYCALFEDELSPEWLDQARLAANRSQPLGSAAFVRAIADRATVVDDRMA